MRGLVLLLAVSSLMSGCHNRTGEQQSLLSSPNHAGEPQSQLSPYTAELQQALWEGNTQFASNLFQAIVEKTKTNENLVCRWATAKGLCRTPSIVIVKQSNRP